MRRVITLVFLFFSAAVELSAQVGSLDTAFDTDGKLTTNFGQIAASANGRGIAVQPSGRIVIGGASTDGSFKHFVIVGLNPDGGLDATFGENGITKLTPDPGETVSQINALKVQADGKIVAAGFSNSSTQERFCVARYNADGTLDTSFGASGVRIVSVSGGANSQDRAMDLAIQPDGKIVVAGFGRSDTVGGALFDMVLMRLDTSGNLDNTFDGDGRLVVNLGFKERAWSVAIAPDGTIFAGGARANNNGADTELLMAKISSTGVVLNTHIVDIGGQPLIRGMATDVIAGTTYILVSGHEGSNLMVGRYTMAGVPDTTFSGDGFVTYNISGSDIGEHIAAQADHKMVVGGYFNADFGACRFLTTGAPDTTYGDGTDGCRVNDLGAAATDWAQGGALQPDGKFIQVGDTNDGAGSVQLTMKVARYTTAGALDPSFDGDGYFSVTTITGGTMDRADALTVDSSGRMILAGASGGGSAVDFAVARYAAANGALDTTFSTDGKHTIDFGTSDYAYAVMDDAGAVFLAGETTGVNSSSWALARLTSAGATDNTFDGDGKKTISFGSNGGRAYSAVRYPDGRILVGGNWAFSASSSDFAMARMSSTGVLDNTFSGDGLMTINAGGFSEIRALALIAGGKILAAGKSTSGSDSMITVARFNDNGSLDTTFGVSGYRKFFGTAVTPHGDEAWAISVMHDGKIVVAGKALVASGRNGFCVGRLNADGSMDTSFDGDGVLTTSFGADTTDEIRGVSLQYDEKIIAFGTAQVLLVETPDFGITRYNWDDGSLDTFFDTDGKVKISIAGTDNNNGGYVYTSGTHIGKGVAGGIDWSKGDFSALRYLPDPAPTLPGTPVLNSGSDSGRFNNDRITNDVTPTFNAGCTNGNTVLLKVDNSDTLPKSRHLCRTGTYAATIAVNLADGVRVIKAYSATGLGPSADTGTVSVTIDTIAAPPSISTPADNTQFSLATAQAGISFTGSGAEGLADVSLMEGVNVRCTDADFATAGGAWDCSGAVFSTAGNHVVHARQIDIAGNTSPTAGQPAPVTRTVIVVAPPVIAKAFTAPTMPLNSTTTLTFTLTNPAANTVAQTGVAFSDTLPAGLEVAATPNVVNNCGGTFAPAAGATSLTFSGGGIGVNASCTVSVALTAITPGTKSNTTGTVSSTNGGTGLTASASIDVFAPPVISLQLAPDSIPQSSNTVATYTISAVAGNPGPLTGVAFTDTLPSGLVVATPNGLSGTCGGGSITATANSSTVVLSGASLAAGAQCSFSVNLKGTEAGLQTNDVQVTSTNGGTGNTASASVTVVGAPLISKAFVPTSIPLNGTTTLTINLTNPPANTVGLTGVAVTDNLPAGLVVADVPALTNNCSGTVLADPGTSVVSLSGGTLAVGGNCSFSVAVKGTTAGMKDNTTEPATATEGGTGLSASASVLVIAPPSLSKGFNPTQVAVGQTSTLTFNVTNGNAASSLSGIGFTDPLPPGLVIATPNGLAGTCGGGTITANAGETSITLAGATLAATTNCSFSVNILGNAAGAHQNTTSTVASTEGGAGAAANATLTVVAPPNLAKNFGAADVALNTSTSLTFTVTNPAPNTVSLSGVGFVDNLPNGMVVSTPNGLSGTCGGGTITANDGAGSVTLSGATLAVGAQCTFSVNVTMTSVGTKVNTTNAVTSTEGGTGQTATASVTVKQVLALTKVFGAPTIPLGTATTLTFTVSNPNAAPETGIAFSDSLPAGLEVATPNGLTGTCGAGTITAAAGTGIIALSGADVAANGNCVFSVNVKGTTAGAKNNTTGAISSNESGTGGTASASLTVVAPPALAKNFGAASIVKGSTTSLTFQIDNSNATIALSGVGFTDVLPAGLIIATPSGLTGGCSGGAITADAGTGSIALSGATIASAGSCSFSVNVVATSGGDKVNTTSVVTSAEGGNGGTATASLTVVAPPVLTKVFGVSSMTMNATTSLTFTVQNPGENSVPLTGVDFSDTLPAGMIVATPNGLSGVCSGGTITAAAGGNVISLTGGVLPVQSSCVFSVVVKATSDGMKSNVTSVVTSLEGGNGTAATADVNVVAGTPVSGVRGDANADDRADILWRHATNGANALWLLNGVSVQSGITLPGVADNNMQIVGSIDIDGDLMSDVIWRNPATGQNATWLLTNGNLRLGLYLTPVPDPGMTMAGIGDFDGDGLGDVFWWNQTTGETAVWLMNGANISNSGMLATVADTNIKVRGIGDVNGDGRDDIIWRNQTTGDNAVWFMNGITKLGRYLPPLTNDNLVIAGVGDFNGDTKSDVLWRNTANGDLGFWFLDGNNISSVGSLPTVTDLQMNVAGVGDVNGDGKPDIIFRHGTTGENAVWFIDGGAIVGGGYLPQVSDTSMIIRAPK